MVSVKKQTEIKLKPPKIFQPLWTGAKRRNFIYGGRGSGKSHDVAEFCVIQAHSRKIRILCTRELQKSIEESVYTLLCDKIAKMGLSDFFTIYKNSIVGNNGSEFIFAGVRQNINEIKSMENISICWVEEAQSMSRESLDILTPTIRAEGSILIFTFNPYKDTDPVYVEAMNPDENTLVIKANYKDNPYFPDVLRLEMERDKKNDYEKYLWVWEGECLGISKAQIFRGKYEVKDFTTPSNAEFHFGVDWGFSNDPTACIRSFVIGNTLYIDQAAGKVGCDLEDTPSEIFNKVDGTSIYPIYADNARPETISFMRKRRYNIIPCEKWGGSVEDGIQYLRSFQQIVIKPELKDVIKEFELYQYKVDKQTGEVLREPVDKFNHFIDALRYSHTVTMRGENNGKVYEQFTNDNICPDTTATSEVYCGTFQLPGKVLIVLATVQKGKVVILDAFSQTVVNFTDIKRSVINKEMVWMPFVALKDIQQNLVQDCLDAEIEPAVGGVLPADGEGTKLVNDLFVKKALLVSERAWTLISCLNERVFLTDGKLERSSKEQENSRFCRLFEYLVWRIIGRLGNE